MIKNISLVFTGVVVLFFIILFFMVDGYNICEKHYKHELFTAVGIKDIVKCNNAYSNWYEIVWIENKEVK